MTRVRVSPGFGRAPRFVMAPPAEPKVKTVADVLRHAALIIEERGHTQFTYEWAGAVCLVGAVNTALHGDPRNDHEWISLLNDEPFQTVAHHLGTPMITDWNDAPGRTAAEVTAALRAAADEADR